MSDINLVENLSSIELLEPEKVSEICGISGETIAAYSTSYAELEAERDALQAKLDLIDLKFKSGNSIPVERITVKRDEFYKLEGEG